jgi:mono/diheme cytochrome c family protein
MIPAARPVVLAAVLGALAVSATGLGAQTPSGVQPKPFAAGDPAAGKVLVDADCIDCHAKRFNGNADQMYVRADHKIKTPDQLLAQVRACNTQLGKSYFPEEEEHVAAYLNLKYYKFAP